MSGECFIDDEGGDMLKKLTKVYNNDEAGIVPMVCREDLKVFIWDSTHPMFHITRAFENDEEEKFCLKLIQALQSECARRKNNNASWENDLDELEILLPVESTTQKFPKVSPSKIQWDQDDPRMKRLRDLGEI